MFFRCQREYFLHYYGSAGGHELHADRDARLLHRLRNMVDMPEYINHLLLTVLYELFISGGDTPEFFRAQVEALLQRELSDMLLGRGEFDHKILLLRELTLPGANHIQLKSELCAAVRRNAELWQQNALQIILSVPVEQRLFFPMPLPVDFGEIKCFCAPAAIWLQEGFLNIVEISPASDERTALHCLYAMNQYGLSPEKVRSWVIADGVLQATPLPESFSGALRNIRNDLDQMMFPGRSGIYCEKDFYADRNHCEQCRFHIFCN